MAEYVKLIDRFGRAKYATIVDAVNVPEAVSEYLNENPVTAGVPTDIPPASIAWDEGVRPVSLIEKEYWNSKQAALGFIPAAENHDHTLLYEPLNENIQAHVTTSHAPANAQANNISDAHATALTGGGETSLHTHPAGLAGGDLWTIVKLGEDFTSSLAANTPVPGFKFTPAPNKTYLIFGYFMLRTATATVGARPGVAWPSNLTDSIMRMEASNSLTTSALRLWGAQTTQNAASTGLATTTNSHWGSLDGIMITAANTTGDFQITLATETAGTNVTIRGGSLIMYREL